MEWSWGKEVEGEDGNEGKQTEMSLHTYHTHIHTPQSAQLSSRNSALPLFFPDLGVWEHEHLAPPPLVNHGGSHAVHRLALVWSSPDNVTLLSSGTGNNLTSCCDQ